MALVPAPIVPAPEPLRARYGLFTSAAGPLDLSRHGEGGGVRYVPETCGAAYPYGVTCYGPGNPAPAKPHDSDNAEVESGVFAVLSTINCGAPGYTREEYRNKALRRLEGGEQSAVEAAFWDGLDLAGDPLNILTLTGPDTDLVTGAWDEGLVTDVIGALERYAYTIQGYGYQAYIHAPVEVAAFGHEAGLVLKDGNRLVTPMGSIWSFGAYGSGSIVITGQTTVWRAPEIQVYDAFDRETNEVLVVAERTYAVTYDCFAGRAKFDPLEVTSP